MNCPHCETDIDEHEASRCLDAWVAEAVMGKPTRHSAKHWMGWHWVTKDGMRVRWYSTDIRAAWEVHETQIGKLFSKRREYLLALEEELREREKFTAAWPDALIFLSPLAICRAALKAVYVGEDEK